jgi:hypothetical protein
MFSVYLLGSQFPQVSLSRKDTVNMDLVQTNDQRHCTNLEDLYIHLIKKAKKNIPNP